MTGERATTRVTQPPADPGEQVLVIPRGLALDGPGWHGVRRGGLERIRAAIASAGRFVSRRDAEVDPSLKQIIPYLVLRDGPRYFLMRRTRAGGDVRLHERWSIGVGGHLNPGDRDLDSGLLREWHEEVEADFVPSFNFVGLLNDDDTDVGSVHLGVVYVADARGRPVSVRETDKLEGAFAPPESVDEVRERLETWSALVFDFLEREADRRPSGEAVRL